MYFTDETLPIKSIKPYARNAKKHHAEQIANIAESIRQFGWTQPIAVVTLANSTSITVM